MHSKIIWGACSNLKLFILPNHLSFLAAPKPHISISRSLVTLALPPLFSLTILASHPHLTCRYYISRSLTASIDQERKPLCVTPSIFYPRSALDFLTSILLGRPKKSCLRTYVHYYSTVIHHYYGFFQGLANPPRSLSQIIFTDRLPVSFTDRWKNWLLGSKLETLRYHCRII